MAEDQDAAYFKLQMGPNHWQVLKADVSISPVKILARHVVKDGTCDCPGFKHRVHCRHVDMVNAHPKGVDRITARKIAADLVQDWAPLFERIVFDEYEFMDPSEEVVKKVRLKANGKPIMIDGKSCRTLTGIRDGVFVELQIVG